MFFISLLSYFCFQDIQIFVIFPFSTLSRFKRTSDSGMIYDVMNLLAYGRTQKPLTKLKRGLGLPFGADFLHDFSIEVFLI